MVTATLLQFYGDIPGQNTCVLCTIVLLGQIFPETDTLMYVVLLYHHLYNHEMQTCCCTPSILLPNHTQPAS